MPYIGLLFTNIKRDFTRRAVRQLSHPFKFGADRWDRLSSWWNYHNPHVSSRASIDPSRSLDLQPLCHPHLTPPMVSPYFRLFALPIPSWIHLLSPSLPCLRGKSPPTMSVPFFLPPALPTHPPFSTMSPQGACSIRSHATKAILTLESTVRDNIPALYNNPMIVASIVVENTMRSTNGWVPLIN